MRKIRKIVAAALLVILAAAPLTVQAQSFRDVGANLSWAQEAISSVTNLGIMTGDASGNFNPNATISKFDAMRMFARMLGFNPVQHTVAQRAYYDTVFEARRSLIESFDGQFVLWNSAMNREIAFLLYRGILNPTDLDNFITVSAGFETRRNITREEVAVYLTRFLDGEQQAMQTTGVALFADDHLITPAMRPHVYFLRSLGILNGSNGFVDPRSNINRAAMAMLIHSTLQHENSPLLGGNTSSNTTNNNNTNNNNPAVETINGTIATTFPSIRSILTQSANQAHNNRVYPVANNAIITVANQNATFAQLQADMVFTAVLANGEIVSIHATGANNSNNQGNQGGGNANNNNNNTTNNSQIPPVANMRVLDGTVARINQTANTVGIETRSINPRNEIITEINDFALVTNTQITRNNAPTTFGNIAVGDLVVAYTYGNTVYIINLEERVRQVSGILIEKNFGTSANFPSIVIEDANGNTHNFIVDSSSSISRGNQRNLTSRQLRIGDQIDLWAENGRVSQIQARAVPRTAIDVYVRGIFISANSQSFIVVNGGSHGEEDSMHLLVDGLVDPREIIIGTSVRLWFDSQEIIGFTSMTSSSSNFSGQVQNITGNQIVVRDANFHTRTFTFDNSTVFFNSVTGQIVNINSVGIGTNVQVVPAQNNNNRANSVIIVAN